MGFRRGVSTCTQQSKTAVKRKKYPYRREYLKHNPGIYCGTSLFSRTMRRLLLGSRFDKSYNKGIYRCAQCHRYYTESEIEIDHIVPISKWYGMNKLVNCVATCKTCNHRKSDSVSYGLIVKGVLAKIREELFVLVHKITHPSRV